MTRLLDQMMNQAVEQQIKSSPSAKVWIGVGSAPLPSSEGMCSTSKIRREHSTLGR